MRKVSRLCQFLIGGFVCAACNAQDAVSASEAAKRFGMDVDTIEVKIETVAPGRHVLFGAGGNVVASIGNQGVLIVDDQFPQMIPKIEAAIRELGGDDIDFVINTHWHFDHADGNTELGKGGSWIVSQSNSRQMMTVDQRINLVSMVVEQPPYPHEALPVITFDDRMRFHFNDEDVDLLHFGPAHTTGDTAVIFRGQNVVHMGDVFNMSGYPFIDADNGGDLNGVIRFCESVLKEINEDAIVVPGHGPVSGHADLVEYVEMLKTIRDRITAMIENGATLDEVIAAKPTAEWDEKKGDPASLLNRAFTSLKKPKIH